ncbi:MAG: GGDEF domain-containing protein [Lachnospiraceae bacterium]|nr:GGDEF domain-containing protein [Lachnospiraceae bacterium]
MSNIENTAGKINKIAVFTNGWSCEFLSEVFEGIRKEAEADSVDIFTFVTYLLPNGVNSIARNQLQLFHLFDPAEFDGIIVLANTFNTPEELNTVKDIISKSSIPAVSIARHLPGVPLVASDNYRGAYELAKHLVEEHGCKDFVFVSGYEGNEECEIRKKALDDVLSEHGLSVSETLFGHFDYYQSTHLCDDWINSGKPLPDVFVCANDHMALGFISSLYHNGIDVPGEVRVTGYDDILDGRFSYPAVATVTRSLSSLGSEAYKELIEQINDPDPGRERILESHFVPNESCGCPPSETTTTIRQHKMRNFFHDNNETTMVDFFFQEIRVAMSQVENKEMFHDIAEKILGRRSFFGENYCLITEPVFFELDDNAIRLGSRHFHPKMDVLFEARNGNPTELRQFNSAEMYPDYKKEPGRSNVYTFSAMYGNNMCIGYIALKNFPSIIYDQRFKRWLNNMESLMVTARQYVFAQKANKQLKEIYMNDFLTGMYNRTGCEDVLYSYIEDRMEKGVYTTLLFADINFMKEINDGYGHLNGDLAIKATAKALKNSLPDDWLFGRYGGDEFIAVGPGEETIDINSYREKFTDSLKQIAERLKIGFSLSASLGYCQIAPDDNGYIGDFIRIADMSMYEEKQKLHAERDRERSNIE